MPMHILKPFVQQPLIQYDYCSHGNGMFDRDGADVMVHLPSSADGQPEKNTSYVPSYFAFFSRNPFLGFLGGDLSGRLLRHSIEFHPINQDFIWKYSKCEKWLKV